MKFRLIVFTLSLIGYSCVCKAQSNTSNSAGTVNVQQSTASSLKVDLSGTGANATPIKVDNSGVTQPVNCTSGCSSVANDSVNLTLSADGVSADYTPSSGIKSAIVSVDFGWIGSITVSRYDNNAGAGIQGTPLLWGMGGTNAGTIVANPLVSVSGAVFAVFAVDVTGASFIRFFPDPWTSGTAHIRVTGTTASFNLRTALGSTLVNQSGTWIVQPGDTANTTPWLTTDSGTSATAATVPATAGFVGGNGSGKLTGLTVCDKSAQLQMTTATTTQIVGLVNAQSVRVCSYAIQGSTTSTATTLKFQYGIGTNCGTGTTQITPAWNMPATSTGLPSTFGSGTGELFHTLSSNALCATNSAVGTVNIFVTYTQY